MNSLIRSVFAFLACLTVWASAARAATGPDMRSRTAANSAAVRGIVTAAYSFPSEISQGNRELGEIDTLAWQARFQHSIERNDDFRWLIGFDSRRIQASVPIDAPIPNTLQSAAARVGFDWKIDQQWGLRIETAPGLYSDFDDISGDDFNSPVIAAVTFSISPTLTVGAGLSIDARREAQVVGGRRALELR